MTKQEILDKFSDIDFVYNDSSKHDTLSRMLDELLEEQEEPKWVVRKQCKTERPDGAIVFYAEWYCPHCNSLLKQGYGAKWIKCCFNCGKPVIWEDKQDVEHKQDATN